MRAHLGWFGATVLTAIAVAACGGANGVEQPVGEEPAGTERVAAPDAAVVAGGTTLTAIQTDAVALDAGAGYLSEALILEVVTKGAREGDPDGPVVRLQAAYDADSVVLRAEWADATESVMKSAWAWDGAQFSKSGDEDRLMLAFPIGNNAEFASKGCAAGCHNTSDNEDEWWIGSDSADVRYDSWHWKSARTDPAGYADDQWWGQLEDPTDMESSRRNDEKDSGGYADNVDEAATGPLFMGTAGSEFIMSGEEVELDTATLAAGDVIPGYVLSAPVGSRGDVEANGVWANGKWVLVMRRMLDTGHEDDALFTVPKPLAFGLSVVDDGGGLDHTIGPDVLTLEWQ